MPKCDFNKVALQLYWNCTLAWVFSCKFAAYFQTIFSEEHLWVAASERVFKKVEKSSLKSHEGPELNERYVNTIRSLCS